MGDLNKMKSILNHYETALMEQLKQNQEKNEENKSKQMEASKREKKGEEKRTKSKRNKEKYEDENQDEMELLEEFDQLPPVSAIIDGVGKIW